MPAIFAWHIARKHIENVLKGTVVGEEYYALGHTQFGSLINKIKLKKPDVIYAIIVGGSNVSFYKQLKAAGITSDKWNLLTISVTEDEVLGIGGENFVGFYSAMKYFQSLENDNNKKFVEAFKAKYGPKSVIGDVTQAAYLGPWLWKLTVEKCGSFDIDKVAAASSGVEFTGAPEGYVRCTRAITICGANCASANGRRMARPRCSTSRNSSSPIHFRRAINDAAGAQRNNSKLYLPMLAYSGPELWSIFVMQSFAGLSLFSVLLLMALGLAIIFGQMGVVNLAHGEFMALGAYTVYLCSQIVQNHAPALQPYYFIIAIAVAFLAAALVGWLVEWSLIRFLYRRPLDTLLATWGLSLIMQQSFRSIFGAREVTPTLPAWLMGSFKPTPTIDIPINGVFVMGLTLLLTFGVWLFMYRSRVGLHMRATVQDRVMSGAVGINTKLVDRFTFCLGCGIAGVAGAAFTTIGSTGVLEMGRGGKRPWMLGH